MYNFLKVSSPSNLVPKTSLKESATIAGANIHTAWINTAILRHRDIKKGRDLCFKLIIQHLCAI